MSKRAPVLPVGTARPGRGRLPGPQPIASVASAGEYLRQKSAYGAAAERLIEAAKLAMEPDQTQRADVARARWRIEKLAARLLREIQEARHLVDPPREITAGWQRVEEAIGLLPKLGIFGRIAARPEGGRGRSPRDRAERLMDEASAFCLVHRLDLPKASHLMALEVILGIAAPSEDADEKEKRKNSWASFLRGRSAPIEPEAKSLSSRELSAIATAMSRAKARMSGDAE